MFVAYLDESDDGEQRRIFAVAAFIGRAESWARLEWKWQGLLREYGIKRYHAVEAETLVVNLTDRPSGPLPGS